MTVASYTKSGSKSATPIKLDKSVFGLDVRNHQLLKDIYITHLSNQRASTAKTKHRGEVRGGGSKPWRQKGTGRARFGSSRNPIWRGGGSAFGPTGTQNPTRKLNQKAKQLGLRQALSIAAKEDKIKIIELTATENTKAKDLVNFMGKIDAKGAIILVVAAKESKLERASGNIGNLRLVKVSSLNAYDVLNADNILITKDSIDLIQKPALKHEAKQ